MLRICYVRQLFFHSWTICWDSFLSQYQRLSYSQGESLTSVTPIQITGPIFNTEGIYDFKMELLTLDSHDNWVFGLSGFHSQITIGKDVIWEDSTVKNQLP